MWIRLVYVGLELSGGLRTVGLCVLLFHFLLLSLPQPPHCIFSGIDLHERGRIYISHHLMSDDVLPFGEFVVFGGLGPRA